MKVCFIKGIRKQAKRIKNREHFRLWLTLVTQMSLPSAFFLQRYSWVCEHDASFHLPSLELNKTQSLPLPWSSLALLSQSVNTEKLESLQVHVPSRDLSRYPNQDSILVKFSRKRCSYALVTLKSSPPKPLHVWWALSHVLRSNTSL